MDNFAALLHKGKRQAEARDVEERAGPRRQRWTPHNLSYDEATLPGTIEFRKEQEYRRDGIPVDLGQLEKDGQEFGVRPGWL